MRAPAVAALGLMAIASAFATAPARAACGVVEDKVPRHRATPGRPPLLIGDSVVLGAVPELTALGYEVNGRVCRQWGEGLRLLRERRRRHTLPSLVVMMLGTNWIVTPADVRTALRLVGPDRVLGLVTPRETGGRSGSDARVIRAAARRHPDRTVLLDWVAYSAGHPRWFAPDGIHLGPGGARGLARLLRRAIPFADPLRIDWQRPAVAEPADPPPPPRPDATVPRLGP